MSRSAILALALLAFGAFAAIGCNSGGSTPADDAKLESGLNAPVKTGAGETKSGAAPGEP